MTKKKQAAPKKSAARGARGKRGRTVAPPAPPVMKVRELDPRSVCGRRTTVEQLFRVDEIAHDDRRTVHLVFLDRHGWYCEHGTSCPAVREVMKLGRQRLLRAS